jgi:hypothetical protein
VKGVPIDIVLPACAIAAWQRIKTSTGYSVPKTWARKGLIDSAVAAGYYRPGGDATKAFEALRAETEGKVNLWYYAWVPQTPEEFTREFDVAASVCAARMLFWEADYIDDRVQAPALKRAMSNKAQW